MTIEELRAELEGIVDAGNADMDTRVMLDVAGRWTGIKGLSVEDGLLFIESED